MTADQVVGLTCAFALGVLVTLASEDQRHDQREGRLLPAPERSALIDRAPPSLQFPLCDEGGWAAFCSDGQECRIRCLGALRVDYAAPARLEAERDLKHIRERPPD